MFWNKKEKELTISLVKEIEALRTEKRKLAEDAIKNPEIIKKLKEEISELSLTKKMEMREVEHLVKMAKEKNAIEFEKKIAEIEKAKQTEMSTMQKEYYEKQMADLKSTTEAILKRLPDITMSIEKTIKE
jgi:predicted RND superfamily exporter protein